jgi:hypothetical protein
MVKIRTYNGKYMIFLNDEETDIVFDDFFEAIAFVSFVHEKMLTGEVPLAPAIKPD